MGEALIELAKKMGVFMIVSQAVLHFGIGRQYEKYVKLLISFMVMAQLVSGFAALFSTNPFGQETPDFSAKAYFRQWEKSMEVFGKRMEEKQKEMEELLREDTKDSSHEQEVLSQGILLPPIRME